MPQRLVILIILFICLLMPEANADTPIIIVGDHSPPFRIFEQGKASGIYFDTIREIGQRMGFTPEFVNVPFKRALEMMRNGSADVMPGPNYSEERADYMLYTTAMLPAEPKAFYYHRPNNRIVRFEDLRGKRVATTLGKDYNRILKLSPEVTLDIVSNFELAIQKVLLNRNDIVVLPEFQGDYFLRNRDIKLFKSPFKLAGKPSHICLSQNSALLGHQKQLQETMKAIVEDGTFQRILERYSRDVTPMNHGHQ